MKETVTKQSEPNKDKTDVKTAKAKELIKKEFVTTFEKMKLVGVATFLQDIVRPWILYAPRPKMVFIKDPIECTS